MILGVEVVMTLMGLYMLCTGRTFGKDSVKHRHVRYLGLFALSFWPVVFGIGMAMVVVWAIMHPGERFDRMPDGLSTMTMVLEVGMVITYVLVVMSWEKRIKAKAAAAAQV